MKIFISHSSADKEYGNSLVDLLRGLGVKDNQIIFTSNVAYGIPIGKNIFNWLKDQINEKPYVIYLLSSEYYSSVACLNEMGAAWIVENEHAIIFTPKFKIGSPEFQNGALDPREIGFYINDEDRLFSFIEQLKMAFDITTNAVLINQRIKAFLKHLSEIKDVPVVTKKNNQVQLIDTMVFPDAIDKDLLEVNLKSEVIAQSGVAVDKIKNLTLYQQFLSDIKLGKLKDEELILIHYIVETGRIKLMTGWQEDLEIKNIIAWEEINELNSLLSRNYNAVIRKFELRKYTDVSSITSSGNAKELRMKAEIEDNILNLPAEILNIIDKVVKKNNTGLPF